jgi:predicted transcriptional regulator
MRYILVAASSGALKTHIVYHANSNFKHIQGYLRQALKSGLLREEGDRYYTTTKGEKFVARVFDLELILGLNLEV